jgi:hypothetical protein
MTPGMAGNRLHNRPLGRIRRELHPKTSPGFQGAIQMAIPFRNSVRTEWNWTPCPSAVNAYRQTLYSMHPHRRGAVMPTTEPTQALRSEQPDPLLVTDISTRKPPQRASSHAQLTADPLLTVDDVARRAQCEQRLGMGSLVAEGATTSGDPHGRRYAAIPRKRD